MKIYRKPHALSGALAMFFACYLYLPSASAEVLNGTEWKVTRGDTLYAIGRAVYPGDARKQARLRRDIMKLNPSVFDNGANNMNVGIVLKLPEYVAPGSTPSNAGKPTPAPIPEKLTPKPGLPSVSAGESSNTEWKVMHGDTLYAICRTIYPGDASMQARLGRDIKKLNPSVFGNGANNMDIGVVLKLPDYVVLKSTPFKATKPMPAPIPEKATPKAAPVPIPDKVTPKPAPVPIPDKDIPEPTIQPVSPTSAVESHPEISTIKVEPTSSPSHTEGGAVVSLGYSYGGNKLADVVDGPDIFAGTGVQMRLGYEQMFQHDSGYRISLGIQYYTLIKQRDVSFKDTYLQLAYQYRVNPIVYGIGVIIDTGATLRTDATNDKYNSAIGAIAYLENIGNGKLAGWGLSATSLNIKEKNSGTLVGASRAELYYSWRF